MDVGLFKIVLGGLLTPCLSFFLLLSSSLAVHALLFSSLSYWMLSNSWLKIQVICSSASFLFLPFPKLFRWVELGQFEYLACNSERRTCKGPQGDGRRKGGPQNDIGPIATMNEHGAVGLASRPSDRAA